MDEFLLIFDDQLSDSTIGKRSNPVIKDLLCISRHMLVSCIWLLQAYKRTLLPAARQQMTDVFIFKLASSKDLQDLLENFDQDCGETPREAITAMK